MSSIGTRGRAVAALVVTMVIWGGSIPVTKAAVADVPPVTLALLRFVLSSAILWPLLALKSRDRKVDTVSWRDAFVLGATGIALYYLGYNVGLLYTSASQAAVLQSAVPAITAVLAFFWLHERVSLHGAIGIALSIAGVLVILFTAEASTDAPRPWLGNGLVAGAIVAWAVYTIRAKAAAQLDPLAVTFRTGIAGGLLLVPFSIGEFALGMRVNLTPAGVASIVYLGAISSALAYLLYGAALRVLGAGQVATYLNLMPIVAVAAAALFLGERVGMWTLLGGAIVLTGITLTTLADTPPDRRIE